MGGDKLHAGHGNPFETLVDDSSPKLSSLQKGKRQGLLEGEKETHLDLEPELSTEEQKLNWKGRWSIDWEGFEQ